MLTGKLVRLRPIELADKEHFYTWINDPEVKRFLATPFLYSMEQEDEFVRHSTMRTQPPHVQLAIETLQDSTFIGSLDLHAFDTTNRHATLGIMIGEKSHWSRGYGTDAIATMLRYGFEELNQYRIDLTVDGRNGRGIACYRKCGFVEEGRLRAHRFAKGRYFDTVMMGILAEEFYALHGQTEAGV